MRNGTKVLSSLLNCENHATVIVIKLRKQRHPKLWTAAGISTNPQFGKRIIITPHPLREKQPPKTPAVLDKNQADPGLGGGDGRGQRTRLIRTDYVPKPPHGNSRGAGGSVSKLSHITPKIDSAENALPHEER